MLSLFLLLSHWLLMPALGLGLAAALATKRRRTAWALLAVSALVGLTVAVPYRLQVSRFQAGGLGQPTARYGQRVRFDPFSVQLIDRGVVTNVDSAYSTHRIVVVAHIGPFARSTVGTFVVGSAKGVHPSILRQRGQYYLYDGQGTLNAEGTYGGWMFSPDIVAPWAFAWWVRTCSSL